MCGQRHSDQRLIGRVVQGCALRHPRTALVAIGVLLLSGCAKRPTRPDYYRWGQRDPTYEPPERFDNITDCIVRYVWRGDGRDAQRVERGIHSTWADDRVAAAFALDYGGHDDALVHLRALVEDPDAVVRRVAAEFLYGGGRSFAERADEFDFRNVLQAEAEVRRLAERIRTGDLRTQYELTKELIALGRPATWALHQLVHDADSRVSLSALYASQEIRAADVGAMPTWYVTLQEGLAMKVSFSFAQTPFVEALERLSAVSGVLA